MSNVFGNFTVSIEADDKPRADVSPYEIGPGVHRSIRLADGSVSGYVTLSVTMLAATDPGAAAAYLRELAAQAQALASDIEQGMKAAAGA
jgi:hypothetical protein